MPTPTTYTYSVSLDMPNGVVKYTSTLYNYLINNTSITISLASINISGDNLNLNYNDVLPTASRTALDGNNGSGGTNGSPSGTHPAAGALAAYVDGPSSASPSVVTVSPQPASTVRSGNALGYIATSATTAVVVRASPYTPPGNNAQRSIKSSSANDTAAGTGAQKVTITYLDASCNGPFTETVTLNGTTAVNTVGTNIALIEKIQVVQVGSGGGNAGTITLLTGIGGAGTTIGTIMVGDNQTFWAHHYTPNGSTSYITGVFASSTINAGLSTLNTLNPINSAVAQSNPGGNLRHGTTNVTLDYPMPVIITGPALTFMNERPDASTSQTAYAQFGWYDTTP